MQLFDDAFYPIIVHDGIFILHANQLALKLFRFNSVSEIIQYHFLDLLDEVSIPLAQVQIAKMRINPEIELPDAQFIFRRFDGTSFLAAIRTRSLGWMGDVLKHEIVFRTIIEQVKEI